MPRAKRSRAPSDPLEIVARALCRSDPDAETPKGKLWETYRKDAQRVVDALGARLVRDDWTPTAEAINALPEPLRRYIMHIETYADPQLTVQQNWQLREQVAGVEAMLQAERAEHGSGNEKGPERRRRRSEPKG